MGNEHVATPFREILASIIRPVNYPINVASHREDFQTRFHPDDLQQALALLAFHLGEPDTLEGWNRLEQAWKHAILGLEAALKRREDDELNAQYRYEQSRKHTHKVNVLEVLYSVREELDDREDSVDGDNGEPMPNWAMRLNRDVNAAIRALGGE